MSDRVAAGVGKAAGATAGVLARALALGLIDAVPGLSAGIDSAGERYDDARRRRAERRDARAAAELAAARLDFCVVNPDFGPCPEIIAAALGLQAGMSSPRAPLKHIGTPLWELLAAAEGALRTTERDGHVCHGHWVTPEERATPRFARGRVWTEAECAELLDEDIEEARGEALSVFGRADDARIELCFWRPCRRLFGGAEDLAEAVRTSEPLLDLDPVRTKRIADGL